MKKSLYLFFLILFCLSCEEEPNNELILSIKDSKASCSGYEVQTECYLVQKGSLIGTDEWEYFYEQIEGFNYEAGFIYKIRVNKEDIDNPPMDAPDVKYTLVKVLSKEEV
jgi:hypothetical protein